MHDLEDGPIDGLKDLYADRPVPSGMEGVAIDRFRAGQASARGGLGRDARWLPRVAAGMALLLAGWGAGHLQLLVERPPLDTPSFVLLLWEGPDFDAGVATAQVAAEYGMWAERVSAEGVGLTGVELDPRRVLMGDAGQGAADPQRDAVLGGYFQIYAASEEDVRALAAEHPHIGYGGWIEVAPVMSR